MEPVAIGRRGATPAGGVTPAELREAERGFKLMLARKFSAVWIADNAKDLLAQANIEYAEWLEKNPPARNPVGWLLTCAYRRALNLLDTQSRKPRPASLDSVFHLADESTPTPEQAALDNDRQRRLSEALSHLPDKERKLLALVYFEDCSIREAGRKLGWRKSAADRHHREAMKKMLALVGGDRKLLSPAILGLAAQATVASESQGAVRAATDAALTPLREATALATEAVEVGAHWVAEIARRFTPLSEPGNAAATSGAGRAAGYCAAAAGAVVCGIAATGVVGPGLSAIDAERPKPAKLRVAEPVRQASAPAPVATEPPRVVSPRKDGSVDHADQSTASEEQPKSKRRKPPQQFAPQATGADTVTEFGVEGGSNESSEPAPATESSGKESPSSTSPPAPSPAPRAPDSAPSAEFGL